MPSAGVEGAGLWLCKGGCGGKNAGGSNLTLASFSRNGAPSTAVLSCRLIIELYINANNNESAYIKSSLNINHRVIPAASSSGEIRPTWCIAGTGTTAQHYPFGPVLVADALFRADLSHGAAGNICNGVSYPPGPLVTTSQSATSNLSNMIFTQNTTKILQWAWSSSSISHADLANRMKCDGYFVPQNYIRYTDQGSYVNRTIIPNIGTLGASYNLEANNVPALWYGV